MVSEGVDPLRIDNLGQAIGMPVGPLSSSDEVSLSLLVKLRDTNIAAGYLKAEDDLWPGASALRETLVKSTTVEVGITVTVATLTTQIRARPFGLSLGKCISSQRWIERSPTKTLWTELVQ